MRRFRRYFTGRVSRAERNELRGWLTTGQLRLFAAMHHADQRHGLDVVAALRADGQGDTDLLVAGLLHDCAKGRELHVWHRVGWSLAEHYGSRVEHALLLVPTFSRAFQSLADHAQRSAVLCQRVGCSEATISLVRHQAQPVDGTLGQALLLADEAN